MSYYLDVAVAFKTEDWNNKVYPEMKQYFASIDKQESDLDMDSFVKNFLAPKFYIHKDDFTVLVWNLVNYWDTDERGEFFNKIFRKYECDYFIAGEDGNTDEITSRLDVLDWQSPCPLPPGLPYLEESWRLIHSLIEVLEKDHGYSEDEVRKAINKHSGIGPIGNYYDLSLIK